MAAGSFNIQKASGGVLNVQPADGTTTTSLVLPAINGTVVAADSNGNVGIGKIPNPWRSDLKAIEHLAGAFVAVGSTDSALLQNATLTSGGWIRNSGLPSSMYEQANGGHYWSTAPSGTAGNTITWTNAMTLDSSGNLGLGVTPSVSTLPTIQSQYNILAGQEESNLNTNAYYSGGVFKYIANGYATSYIQQKFGGNHMWRVAPSGVAGNAITWTNAMTLDASGNLLVGYNGQTSIGNTIAIFSGGTNSYTQLIGRSAVNTDMVYASYISASLKSAILANGNFQSATNSYGSTSDAKLKENIQDASPKLDKLMQVQVRTFNYIGQEDKQIGVVAQEIEKIFPSIVYETKDTKQVEVEKEREITLEDGTVDIEKYTETETVETGEVTKNVKYSVIYMMMLKAMQEQNEIIKDLKSRIEILEAK